MIRIALRSDRRLFRDDLAIEAPAAGALLDAVRTPSAVSAPGLPELTSRECDILGLLDLVPAARPPT